MKPLSVLIAAAALMQAQQPAQQPARGPGRNGLGGASSGFVQNATYDREPPKLPPDLKPGGILIFSKTSGYRDEPAIEASNAALAVIAAGAQLAFLRHRKRRRHECRSTRQNSNSSSGTMPAVTRSQSNSVRLLQNMGGKTAVHSFASIHGAVAAIPSRTTATLRFADWKWYIDTLIGVLSSSCIRASCPPIFTSKTQRVRSPKVFPQSGIVPRNGIRLTPARGSNPGSTYSQQSMSPLTRRVEPR